MKRLGRWLKGAIASDDLDLYILLVSAAASTIAGILGIADVDQGTLVSILLALIALLALSQIRSRTIVRRLGRNAMGERNPVFLSSLPSDIDELRCSSRSVLLIGGSMVRAIYALRRCMNEKMEAGHKVRVVFLDPDVSDIINGPAGRQSARIRSSIKDLIDTSRSYPDQLQLRVFRTPPSFSYTLLEGRPGESRIVLQHRGWNNTGEGNPVFVMTEDGDGRWFSKFKAEAERIWESSTPVTVQATRAMDRNESS